MKNNNEAMLKSFNEYCKKYPNLRFWQALISWSRFNFIYGAYYKVESNNLIDTYYK
jgi:hypothetical protein